MAFQLICDYCKQAKKIITSAQIKDFKDKWVCPDCIKTQEKTVKYIESIGTKFKQRIDGMMKQYATEVGDAISKEAEKRFDKDGADNRQSG